MDCPVCKTPMIILELNQVEIDYCGSCDGIWLDAGELELLLGDSSEKDRLMASFSEAAGHGEKPRRCPRCTKKMNKVHVGSNKDVLVDKCRREHGIWFDRGELHQVVALGSSEGGGSKVFELLNDMFEYKLKHK